MFAQDVFALQRVPLELLDDLYFVNGASHNFERFSVQLGELKGGASEEVGVAQRRIDFRPLICTLEDLIRFTTTATTNQDPLTREGLPHVARQTILLEQGILAQAMRCVTQPTREGIFERSDMLGRERSPASHTALRQMGQLSMRLVRHIIRDSARAKAEAMDHVPSLVGLLECDILAADTLTEVRSPASQIDEMND